MNDQDQSRRSRPSKFRQAVEGLQDTLDRHLIALTIVPEEGGLHELLGSGILVRRDGRAGIVTAAHVACPIRDALDNPARRLPWMVGSAKKASEKTLDGTVVPIRLKLRGHRLHIEGGAKRGARIADIAWIPLPTEMAEQLEAESIHGFYEWKGRTPLSRGTYHFFVLGCVAVQTHRLLRELNEKVIVPEFRQVGYDDFPKCERRNGWDFVTVTVDKATQRGTEERVRLPGIPDAAWEALEKHPSDYSGVSGGPLWWIKEDESGEVDSETDNPGLWGMAFLQWGSDAERGIELNCHGPESIERITSVDYSHTTPSPSRM